MVPNAIGTAPVKLRIIELDVPRDALLESLSVLLARRD